MNRTRKTSRYTVTVTTDLPTTYHVIDALDSLSYEFGERLEHQRYTPIVSGFDLFVSWRATDDNEAIEKLEIALAACGLEHLPISLHTGVGVGRRLVAERVAS